MDVRITGLRLSRGGKPVLNIASLTIDDGRMTALLGPNGAGKSTLLRAIAGLERPSAGEIRVGAERIESARQAAHLVAFAFQENVFMRGSVRDNIDLALRLRGLQSNERRTRIEDVAEACGVGHLLDRAASRLSVGEARRASLARALALRAPVTLLDEPLAALDADARQRLLTTLPGILRRFASTVILVTHDREEARRLAEDVVILMDGSVAASGPREAAFGTPPDARTAAFLGYAVAEIEGQTIAIAPAALRPAPEGGGENMLTVTVTGLVRVPGGHEALVTLGGADFAVFLPIGAHLPRAGDELRLLALPGGLVQFAGG